MADKPARPPVAPSSHSNSVPSIPVQPDMLTFSKAIPAVPKNASQIISSSLSQVPVQPRILSASQSVRFVSPPTNIVSTSLASVPVRPRILSLQRRATPVVSTSPSQSVHFVTPISNAVSTSIASAPVRPSILSLQRRATPSVCTSPSQSVLFVTPTSNGVLPTVGSIHSQPRMLSLQRLLQHVPQNQVVPTPGSSSSVQNSKKLPPATEEIRKTQCLQPLEDMLAETEKRQVEKSKSHPKQRIRKKKDGVTRDKFQVHFNKPSVMAMNSINQGFPECLKELLPNCYEYILVHFKEQENNGSSAVLRADIRNKECALKWVEVFQETACVDLRSHNTFHENSQRIVFKKSFRCHCNTRANEPNSNSKVPHAKHTVCPSNVIITVKNTAMKKSADKHLQTAPCEITINHIHNHGIKRADSLRFRRPTPEVKAAVLRLFKRGHSVTSALKNIKFDLQVKYGDNFFLHTANASICPSYNWCYNLYLSTFKEKYGEKTGDKMIQTLQEYVDNYNATCGSVCAKLAIEGSDIAVAICSPLMKRVHALLRSSGEVVFVDSSGNMDFENTRIFLFNTASVAGGLPLGLVFTTSEASYPLTNAFKLLQEILPEDAFYNRGPKEGPNIFMTDDSTPERVSLRTAFRAVDLILLLCKFHFLQAVWRFLLNSKNGVKAAYRAEIYFLFKQVINATTIDDFNAKYDAFLKLSIVKDNSKLSDYIQSKRASSKEWAMAFRQNLLTRGHNTNNYNEAGTKVIKDMVMERLKAFNMVQLFDFMTVSYDLYYKSRIADCLNNRMTNYRSSRYFIEDEKLLSLTATQESDDTWNVHNKESGNNYRVDVSIDVCSCPKGVTGAPCKHQYFVSKTLGKSSSQFLPLNDPEAKLILHKIMTGSNDVPEGWYDSHNKPQGASCTENELPSTVIDDAESNSEQNINEETPDNVDSVRSIMETDEVETEQDTNDDAISECCDNIDQICEDMKKRARERPEVYLPAFQRFHDRYKECSKSETSYASAFFSFNRACGPLSLRKDLPTGLGDGGIRTGWGMSRMRVQTTAVGRRKTNVGGRQPQNAGRPAESVRSQSKRASQDPNWAHLPTKKKKLPHNLSQRVLQNVPMPSLSQGNK